MILDKSDKVTGYRRSYQVVIDNPKDGIPSITFNLEWIVDKDGQINSLPAGSKTINMDNPSNPLTILNPIDDSVIMPANDGFIQAAIYSLYVRDVANQEVV
jgi:hypothetical protein